MILRRNANHLLKILLIRYDNIIMKSLILTGIWFCVKGEKFILDTRNSPHLLRVLSLPNSPLNIYDNKFRQKLSIYLKNSL